MTSALETRVRRTVSGAIDVIAGFNRRRLPEPDRPHPFLTGLHEPMRQELTIEDLQVTGAIPKALNGRYLRIGPNPIAANPRAYHWFVGDGMIHGVALEDGQAKWYRNRWVRSAQVGRQLHVAPAPGPRHSTFDTVNTAIGVIGGETLALVEAGSTPVRVGEELETIAYTDFHGTLKGAFTAHPHCDPLTGETHAVTYQAPDPGRVWHVVVTPDGRVRREEPIKVGDGPSIHDCAITSRYVLVLDLPVTFSMKSLIGGHPFPYLWNRDHRARVGLLPREGRGEDIVWCDVDPCYVFHVANAFDAEDGRVILDAVAHETMFDGDLRGPSSPTSALERWTIDPVGRTVERAVLDPSPQEFPRIDERRFGRPHRYVYALMLPERQDPAFLGASAIAKHDVQTGARQVHDFGAGRCPGEFSFVPRRDGTEEDAGWLIGLVVDRAADTTALEILEAQDFAGPPLASIHIPHRIPPGFHGCWVAR
ncbi:MAG TPA: carotenoid oxygenase family protein [Phenylobacterium sp.]|uniref:8'-apo-carotenoid 13,14-cleaving dioxygenase n=1 Tax=Phenylobacterium sp. TaxID=1871053 RepID=UPI002B46BE2E|nr:carotenoid oxygenase family protein [Phenylobacterium sp.]HKR88675.1 carotenoid oxygenase family protein [Phenylobacterium sp.]